jgi:CBS domain-containing protein
MEIVGTGKRVRIYIGEKDKADGHHEPLWETILKLLQSEGAAGATLVRGLAGFGAHHQLHMARLADIVTDLPVIIEWLDGPERIERLLPQVCDMVREGTITLEDVAIVKYAHREPIALPSDSVAEVMTREVVVVHRGTPVGEVVRLLLDRDFRSVPVVDDARRLVGIITNRDLIERGGLSARVELLGELEQSALERELAGSGVRERTAADVMTAEVVSVHPNQSLKAAAHVMVERTIKRLPVVDDAGHLLGILSRVDVLRTMGEDYHTPEARGLPAVPGARMVGELMRTDVPSVRADASLGEVLDKVTSTRLNRAIVVASDGRVVGIVSDADLLARLDPGGETGVLDALMGRTNVAPKSTLRARDVMRTPAITATPETPVAEAVQQMLQARRKVLPVVDPEGRLLGAADRADLLAALQLGPAQTT